MKSVILPLLLAAALSATAAERDPFPADYTPLPCAADGEKICSTFEKSNFQAYGAKFRGFHIEKDWINEHWEEMRASFLPFCAQMGSCYAIPGNESVVCQDLFREKFVRVCEKFPEGSQDRSQCEMFARVWFIGMTPQTEEFKKAQACAAASRDAGPRTLDVWVSPSAAGRDFDGRLTVHAIDSEWRVPVLARVTTDGGGALQPTEGPHPRTGFVQVWTMKLRRIPNADGHEDVVAPLLTVTADGYQPASVPIPVSVPKLDVTMTPDPATLKKGRHTVTVTARDAATGEPVEMRVMGGQQVLGNSNEPFRLELKRGETLPEIWLTSLFDRYSDVVVHRAN
jgi:hypothetical protein